MKKSPAHYVDNAKFYQELKTWKEQCELSLAEGAPRPRLTEYIGECILKIASHLANKPNFAGYSYRADMVADAIENAVIYAHNFDPTKTKNPFGYFTQIVYYAFIRRIQREKRHTYIKYKLLEQQTVDGGAYTLDAPGHGPNAVDTTMLNFDNVQEFLRKFDAYTTGRRERRKAAKLERQEETL